MDAIEGLVDILCMAPWWVPAQMRLGRVLIAGSFPVSVVFVVHLTSEQQVSSALWSAQTPPVLYTGSSICCLVLSIVNEPQAWSPGCVWYCP